mmetsp:Transcript_20134/g.52659  ORF Transcript_20134/g.52659 Transcript_20134/m.52659 type:complete len:252 (+) Transcript_20134:195-950(+)
MLRRALALFTMLATTGVRCSTGLQLRSASRAAMITRGGKLSASSSSETVGGPLPKLAVFDMDMCVWSPEMYTLNEVPEVAIRGPLGDAGEGVVAVKSGSDTIRLFPGALKVLQDYHNGKYPGMRIAAASSADTPFAVKIARKALTMLEVVPGVTVREVFSMGFDVEGGVENMQIGRTPPLSSNKAKTHFPILKEQTGVAYDQMIFFDDCNWGDHCAIVNEAHGVVTQRTPSGLTLQQWENCLKKFADSKGS